MMTVDEARQQAMSQCYRCAHKRNVPGNAHISCAKPSQSMMGDEHGKRNGWWSYPVLFDPTWNMTICPNHEATDVVA